MAEKLDPKQARAQAKADAKAAKRAEKERRKHSTDPADMGRIRQVVQAYKLTHEYDKALPWLMLGAFVLPIVVLLAIGFAVKMPLIMALLGVSTGLLLAMLVLVQRTKKATYTRYAGQAGSAEVALQMLGKKWIHSPVINATKHKDVVHRVVGPGGIVLVGEGDPGRVRQLLQYEQRRHEKFIADVSVTTLQMGDKQGQVPLDQLAKRVQKLPKVLQAHQVTDVRSRLRAIDAVRPTLPVPKGPMPTSMRGSRKYMRGR